MDDFKNSELSKRVAMRLSNEEANKLTKECLFEALFRLMKKKPFNKITVSELVKCAGVSRTAFYRSYSSIDQILKERFKGIVEALRKSIKEERYRGNLRLWFYDMLTLLRGHASELELLLEATEGKFVEMRSISDIFEMDMDGSEQARYKYVAFNGAIRDILAQWVRSHCEGDIEFLADFCVKLLELCISATIKAI